MLWRSGYGFCAAPRISCGENRERHAVRERVYGCPQKRNRIGALRWRTLRSRIRFNPERIRWAVQWVVRRMNVLWAVNANWNDDGWNVEANSPSNPNEWNADNEFVSRNPLLSPRILFLSGRGFCQKSFTPTAYHLPRFLYENGNLLKFLARNELGFPGDLNEETH